IYDYLRVLYARIGQGHCPQCGRPITAQTREQILARILALPEGTRFLVLAPVIRGQKGEYKDLFEDMLRRGFVRARVDGQVVRLTDDLKLKRHIKHDIEIVIDRLKVDAKIPEMGRWRRHIFEGVAKTMGIDLEVPWRDLPEQHRNWILFGTGDRHITFEWKQRGNRVWKHGGTWEGIIPQLLSSFKKT